MGKGENAGNQHFLLFSKCFLLYQREREIIISVTFILSSADALNLNQDKFLPFGKGLDRNLFGIMIERNDTILKLFLYLVSR